MIITTTRFQKIGSIEVTETATVKVQRHETIDTALDVLWRIRDRWKMETRQDDDTEPASRYWVDGQGRGKWACLSPGDEWVEMVNPKHPLQEKPDGN